MQPLNLIMQLCVQKLLSFLQVEISVNNPASCLNLMKPNLRYINVGAVLLFSFVILFLVISFGCRTEDVGMRMSGIVLDEGMRPVKGLGIVCLPAIIKEGMLEPGFWIYDYPSNLKSVTDRNGFFKFSNLPHGPIKFALTLWLDKKTQTRQYQLISIKIGTLRYHPYGIYPKYFAFEIKPDPHFENIEVIVRPLTQSRHKAPSKRKKDEVKQNVPQPPPELLKPEPQWVINPANGHAYKRIRCISRDEAQAIAAAEGAYLVAINDETEQKWLEGAFGTHLYWIGLSDAAEEGNWKWSDGSPLTYTNWGPEDRFTNTFSAEKTDYAVMSFVNGEWHPVGIEDLFWRAIGQAILEKESLITSTTAEDR